MYYWIILINMCSTRFILYKKVQLHSNQSTFELSRTTLKLRSINWTNFLLGADIFLTNWMVWLAKRSRCYEGEVWWTQQDSDLRHPRCKRGALPTELWAHINFHLPVFPTSLASRGKQFTFIEQQHMYNWKFLTDISLLYSRYFFNTNGIKMAFRLQARRN